MAISIVPHTRPSSESPQGISKAALNLVGQSTGPFSPIPGPDSLTFCGTLLALAKSHQVDISAVGSDQDTVYEAKDQDGHTWWMRCAGCIAFAFRERTESEMIEYLDQCSSMYRADLSSDHVRAMRRIAYVLVETASAMTPDRCPSREQRRALKKRVRGLASLQLDILLRSDQMPMSEARARMMALEVMPPPSRHTMRMQ